LCVTLVIYQESLHDARLKNLKYRTITTTTATLLLLATFAAATVTS
jgi:hypothetical protein